MTHDKDPFGRRGSNALMGVALALLTACGGGGGAPTVPGTAMACTAAEINAGRLTECLVRDFPAEATEAANRTLDYFRIYDITTPFPWTVFNLNALPTEGLAALWAAGRAQRDDEYLSVAHRQLALIGERLRDDVLPIDETGVFSSNAQIRLAMGYWVAYQETGDRYYLAQADRSARVVFDAPAVMVTSSVTGRTYALPAYLYQRTPEGVVIASGRVLDPNQEATLALMAQLLMVTPGSAYHHSEALATRRDGYVNAAMDLMEVPRCVPVADVDGLRDGCDTTYGWFAIYQLAALNAALKDSRVDAVLRRQYQYHAPITLSGRERRTYPERLDRPLAFPRDALFGLLVAHHLGEEADEAAFYALAGPLLGAAPSSPQAITEPWVTWVSRMQDQISKALLEP